MPIITASAVSAVTVPSPAAGFAPAGLFVVRVHAGGCILQAQLPGTTEWLSVAEVQGNVVAPVTQMGGTLCEVTPGIGGTKYRFLPVDGPLTADAVEA